MWGLLRSYTAQIDLTSDVARRSWYGEHHLRGRFVLFLVLHGVFAAWAFWLVGLNDWIETANIRIANPHLTEPTVLLIQKSHEACAEALCRNAKTITTAVCTTTSHNDGGGDETRHFDWPLHKKLHSRRKKGRGVVLEFPNQCQMALQETFGDLLSDNAWTKNAPPVFSLDPDIPAIFHLSSSCNLYLDYRVFLGPGQLYRDVEQEQFTFPTMTWFDYFFTTPPVVVDDNAITFSPSTYLCPNPMSAEPSEATQLHEWVLSTDGRSMIGRIGLVLYAVWQGLIALFAATKVAIYLLVPAIMVARVLRRLRLRLVPSSPPNDEQPPRLLLFWDTVMAVELIMLLTLPVLTHTTTRSELQLGHFFQHAFLILASLWFGQYKAAFEWFFFWLALGWWQYTNEKEKWLGGGGGLSSTTTTTTSPSCLLEGILLLLWFGTNLYRSHPPGDKSSVRHL
jgi:hypothetical protein